MTVFISRTLPPDSTFLMKLMAHGCRVHGERLVRFEPVPIAHLPEGEWLFFYSKTGVRFFFQQIPPSRIEGYRVGALGPGTAAYLENYCHVHFAGDGDPLQTAVSFLQLARGQRVVFVRAANSRESIQQLLTGKLIAIDLVVYDNRLRDDFDVPDCEVLVFTSPLNAKAYFSKKKKYGFQKVIAIGDTTREALEALGIRNVHVADAPTEDALADKVLALAGKA